MAAVMERQGVAVRPTGAALAADIWGLDHRTQIKGDRPF